MKIEDQVCSLEFSKKLKELGINQESLFYWADGSIVSGTDFEILLENGKIRTLSSSYNDWPDQDINELYSAFTVAELGRMIKWKLLMIMSLPSEIEDLIDNDISEADFRAKVLILTIGKGLVKVEDINNANI